MDSRVVVDIGNTRVSSAVFVDGNLVDLAHHLLSNVQSAAQDIVRKSEAFGAAQIAICSVVPTVTRELIGYLDPAVHEIYQVAESSQKLIAGTYSSLGADRIANIAAAFKLYAQDAPAIVLDFGTATTLSAVSPEGRFLGGLITLGLTQTFHALHHSTEQLPDLQPAISDKPPSALESDTAGAISSGCLLAHVGLIEIWLREAKQQLGSRATVIATGGSATTLAPLTKSLDHVDPNLTIYGINFIAQAAMDQVDQV